MVKTSGPVLVSLPGELQLGDWTLVLEAPRSVSMNCCGYTMQFRDTSCAWGTAVYEIPFSFRRNTDGQIFNGTPLRWAVSLYGDGVADPSTRFFVEGNHRSDLAVDLMVEAGEPVKSFRQYGPGDCQGANYSAMDPSPFAPVAVTLQVTVPEEPVEIQEMEIEEVALPLEETPVVVQEEVARPLEDTEVVQVAVSLDATPESVVESHPLVEDTEVVREAQLVGYDQTRAADLPTNRPPDWLVPAAVVVAAGILGWALLRKK